MKIEYFSGEIEAIGHVPNGQTLIINVETVYGKKVPYPIKMTIERPEDFALEIGDRVSCSIEKVKKDENPNSPGNK